MIGSTGKKLDAAMNMCISAYRLGILFGVNILDVKQNKIKVPEIKRNVTGGCLAFLCSDTKTTRSL
jgi:hypothetical protein